MSNAEIRVDNVIAGAVADAASEWVPVTARYDAARLVRERLNLAGFVEPTGDARGSIVEAVRDSFLAEDGCGSDMQTAAPEWEENGRLITFCGEGSIDVEHLISDVFNALHKLGEEGRL